MTDSYDDIINLPRPISPTRPPMAPLNRAAQFAPFAALSGYEAAVKETARLTDKRIELDEYLKDAINETLRMIADRITGQPEMEITYFRPDAKKQGGAYVTTIGRGKRIDEYEGLVMLTDGSAIPMEDIISVEVRSWHD
jgi:hypothetical protein